MLAAQQAILHPENDGRDSFDSSQEADARAYSQAQREFLARSLHAVHLAIAERFIVQQVHRDLPCLKVYVHLN